MTISPYNDTILLLPWHDVISGFHCIFLPAALANASLSNSVSKGLDLTRYVVALCKRQALLAHPYITVNR